MNRKLNRSSCVKLKRLKSHMKKISCQSYFENKKADTHAKVFILPEIITSTTLDLVRSMQRQERVHQQSGISITNWSSIKRSQIGRNLGTSDIITKKSTRVKMASL